MQIPMKQGLFIFTAGNGLTIGLTVWEECLEAASGNSIETRVCRFLGGYFGVIGVFLVIVDELF